MFSSLVLRGWTTGACGDITNGTSASVFMAPDTFLKILEKID
jgi:hypothetical protein